MLVYLACFVIETISYVYTYIHIPGDETTYTSDLNEIEGKRASSRPQAQTIHDNLSSSSSSEELSGLSGLSEGLSEGGSSEGSEKWKHSFEDFDDVRNTHTHIQSEREILRSHHNNPNNHDNPGASSLVDLSPNLAYSWARANHNNPNNPSNPSNPSQYASSPRHPEHHSNNPNVSYRHRASNNPKSHRTKQSGSRAQKKNNKYNNHNLRSHTNNPNNVKHVKKSVRDRNTAPRNIHLSHYYDNHNNPNSPEDSHYNHKNHELVFLFDDSSQLTCKKQNHLSLSLTHTHTLIY